MRFMIRAAIALSLLSVPAAVLAQTPTPTTQNTVTTTGPVSSNTTIETGTLAGEALTWVATTFGATIGAALTALLIKALKNAGIAGTDLMRARLQEIVINGLNFGAKEAADRMQGAGKIEVKNAVVSEAVKYVQAHGADELKALGEQPETAKAVEAIKARIETAIADPAQATPAVLAPTVPPVAKI